MTAKKKGLGRGLDALFIDNEQSLSGADKPVNEVPIADIEPDKNQPRKVFDEEKLNELAASIKEHGVITPLIVSPIEDGRYKIIAGERRWRAARKAGVKKLPVVVKEFSKQEAAEIALIENLQREDLNIIEEAKGYESLKKEFSLTQDEIAKRVGKSRPVIANAMRLLSLGEEIVNMLENGRISSGHGKVLLSVEDKKVRLDLAKKCAEGLTVRELEAAIKKLSSPPKPPKEKDINITALETRLKEATGRRVKITGSPNKGKLTIEYTSLEDLNSLSDILLGE